LYFTICINFPQKLQKKLEFSKMVIKI